MGMNRMRLEGAAMSESRLRGDPEWAAVAGELRRSGAPDIEKLASAFDWITVRIITGAEQEIEAARALRDEGSAVKQQVKMETIRHARSIFEQCYLLATGRKAWDGKDTL